MSDQTRTLKTACRCAQFCMLRMSLCVVSLLSLSTMVSMMLKVYLSLYTLLRSHLFVNCCIRRYSLYILRTDWEYHTARFMRNVWMIDCNSLNDHLRNPTFTKCSDKRLSIDLAALRQMVWLTPDGELREKSDQISPTW